MQKRVVCEKGGMHAKRGYVGEKRWYIDRKDGMPVRKGGMRVNISEKGVTPVNSQKKGGMRVIRRYI